MKRKKEYYLFGISFVFLVVLGILLSYNYDFSKNYNLLFDSDTARVIGDAINPSADHNRLDVHPLFVLFVQPTVFLLSGLFQNKILSLVILSAFLSSISTVFIYKILNLFHKNEKTNLLLSIIYLVSFSNLIFTTGIETYNFAVVFLILLWYFILKKMKEKEITLISYILLIGLGLLSASFTITNFVIYLIGLFLLWIAKRINWKKGIVLVIAPLALLVGFSGLQRVIWGNTPFILKTNIRQEKNNFSETTIGPKNVINVLENDYKNSLISEDINLKIEYGNSYNGLNYHLYFEKSSILNLIIIGLFYLLTIILLIRNWKQNILVNLGLLLAIGFNSALHIIYGNTGAFLYSLHFVYLFILLLGINLQGEKNEKVKKVSEIFLYAFAIYETIKNLSIFSQVLKYAKEILNPNKLVARLGSPLSILLELALILITGFAFYGIYKLIMKTKKDEKEKRILKVLGILLIIIGLESLFIMLENSDKILWFKNQEIKETIPKDKTDYLEKDFKEYFKEEIKSLENYKEEYESFKATYQNVETGDSNWSDYFYFGLGNRRKLYYSEDRILDLDSKEVIYSFKEKEHLLIPNEYAVIIETVDHDYIKIYEDKEGVHFKKNDKDEIIEGTNVEINLYTFENQKYQNMKKVLYNEILFNIKNSTIYPNIIVYENPWYRDAALVSMVLKETNNTDLIKDWVDNITEIYDKQNGGVEEADNLGELLVILSTQENKNNDLINKIESEAERIANENPNGYYIYGKTDFGDQYYYQNLWYKLGIESVGRIFHFDISSLGQDEYTKMAWWSDVPKTNTGYEVSMEYPYLSIANRHALGQGTIALNRNLYPLSWEREASQAKYENYASFDNRFVGLRLSPLHSWHASEMLLFLLQETND